MKRFAMKMIPGLLLAVLVQVQNVQAQENAKTGEAIFAQSCSSGYCHGSKGAGSGAPRLSGRGFDQAFIRATVSSGVTGTSMPAFGTGLSPADLTAVVAYVSTLNGIMNPTAVTAPISAATALSADAARGRALFSESARSFGRCSTCHEVGGIGISVATPISNLPADATALKNLQTPSVLTATVGGENIPILMVSRKAQAVTFYDLTSAPPVLRTVAPNEIQTRDGSSWSHASVTANYTPAELTSILAYLRAVR